MNEPLPIDHGDEDVAEVKAAASPHRGKIRNTTRKTIREPIHDPSRGAVVTGRNGEILTRTSRADGGDPMYVDPSIIPQDWEYQWNTTDVYGNNELTRQNSNIMYRNGWRPVPADRHPGMFMPHGYTGPIIVAGARLEERPKILCEEARAEGVAKARRVIQDQNESVVGGLKKRMAPGMEIGGKYRGTGGDMRMSIDKNLDIPQSGNYEYPEAGQ